VAIKGVILDLDGTVVDVTYDWGRINAELGTQGVPILTYLSKLEEPEKSRKWRVLEKYENGATAKARLKPGMKEFLGFLGRKGLKKALVSNNSRVNVEFLLHKFGLEFDCVLSRESGLWKPSGAPFLEVMKKFGLAPDECAVVGDSHFDVNAAGEAGIRRVFLLGREKEKLRGTGAEIFPSVESLERRMEQLLGPGKI
jgi:HAD superfamily hydrolase (TIGR01509 family)